METSTHPEATMQTSTNPILAQMNRTADDPSVAVYLPIPQAVRLIEMSGGERVTDGPGTWVFPDGFWTWSTEEAAGYAIQAISDGVLD